ncbi:MAG: 2-isopropylmalate synthase [Crenarchaeota archaeon]|nr:2-isopropylmalate synthase [Thermoproteota archaeon]
MRILDTTLRDGEQTPGLAFRPDEKLQIALLLEELNVDSIEAGFPAVSRGEYEAVKMIAREVSGSEIVALCRCNRADIDLAVDCDVDAVHLFIATSDIHLKYKLRISREEALRRAIDAVEYAKSHGLVVEFSAEDSTRTEWTWLARFFQEIVNAGADRLDIADTVGVMWPSRMQELVRYVLENVRGSYILSVHCHNDFGMATANSIAAAEAGAGQVHVTVAGLGERAGNAPLEEVVTALQFLLGYRTGIRFEKLKHVCERVLEIAKFEISPNKPIIGINAFSHESGIHVHGIIENPQTYEPIPPELIGAQRRIVIGKHSGKHAVEYVLKSMGITPVPEIVDKILKVIKELGDKGEKITENTIIEIIRLVVAGDSEKTTVS